MINLPLDKKEHLAGGAILAIAFFIIMKCPPLAAVAIDVMLIAFGWEALQWYRKEGTPDIWDALATTAGGVIVVAIIAAIQHFF